MANIKYTLSNSYNPDHEPFYGQVAWLTRDILDSYDGHWDWLQDKFFPGFRGQGTHARRPSSRRRASAASGEARASSP